MTYSEEMLRSLRSDIENSDEISPKRKRHIIAVESMAARLAKLYSPHNEDKLRAAALLHDLTKEYSYERQVSICIENGYAPGRDELNSPKIFHAMTAAFLIPSEYPEFACPEVISAVRWHTTGHSGMTLAEKLIYLADYIDDTRQFEDCVKLREAFFEKDIEAMSETDRLYHLDDIMIMSYQMTINSLAEEGKLINTDTICAYNELLCNKKERK